jgi:rhamnosyltransferase
LGQPQASVIVRAKDRAHTIERALKSLRRQTVAPEIVVVDSGSRDGTVSVAGRYCDKLIEIPAESFTYGRALNLGAQAASAPIHFALSSHCFARSEDWIERALMHYDRDDVAGTCGYGGLPPDGVEPGVVYQDLGLLSRHPFWGFTNHASSWRADVWKRFPFDDEVAGAEDKEWSWRVLEAGYVIALDPGLDVGTSHRFEEGLITYYRRHRRDSSALAGFTGIRPSGTGELVAEWWRPDPDGVRSTTRLRLSPWRIAGLLGRQAGLRRSQARRDP